MSSKVCAGCASIHPRETWVKDCCHEQLAAAEATVRGLEAERDEWKAEWTRITLVLERLSQERWKAGAEAADLLADLDAARARVAELEAIRVEQIALLKATGGQIDRLAAEARDLRAAIHRATEGRCLVHLTVPHPATCGICALVARLAAGGAGDSPQK